MVSKCFHCGLELLASGNRHKIVRFGYFVRKCDRKLIQRFRCLRCQRSFSTATLDICFKQHKREFNKKLGALLVSGVSQRRASLLLKINRKTVVRKFIFLGVAAQSYLPQTNLLLNKCKTFQFDDLETFEHTKLKPLSVTLAVEHPSRRILGFRVSRMPAKGLLAEKSVKKYGRRKDLRSRARNELFQEISPMLEPDVTIKSDENPHYVKDVRKHFPKAKYETFLSRRGCVVGQGELKKIGFDPLFSLNHTCAKLRADINRLFRKTWCTTKIPQRLTYHIALYALFHNGLIIDAAS